MTPTPLLSEEALKAYEALERVIVKVMQPTNDNLKALAEEVHDMKTELSGKYYDKTTVDIMFNQLQMELAELKSRSWQVLGGAAAITVILGFAIQHLH